jgi:nitroreductase
MVLLSSAMELSEALRSTGAVRDFRAEPVPDDVLYQLLDTARFAPNGGNRQAWHVIVVRDPDTRVALRDLYLPGWYEYLPQMVAGLTPFAAVTDRDAEAAARARAGEFAERGAAAPGFAEQLHEVPLLLVLTADLRNLATLDRDLGRYTLVGGASIYPFAWSLLLGAHDVGLGGVMTTVAIRQEPELRQLFHLPEHVVVAAVLAFGYPSGKRATKLRRNPVEAFATVDRYDGPPVTPA